MLGCGKKTQANVARVQRQFLPPAVFTLVYALLAAVGVCLCFCVFRHLASLYKQRGSVTNAR